MPSQHGRFKGINFYNYQLTGIPFEKSDLPENHSSGSITLIFLSHFPCYNCPSTTLQKAHLLRICNLTIVYIVPGCKNLWGNKETFLNTGVELGSNEWETSLLVFNSLLSKILIEMSAELLKPF